MTSSATHAQASMSATHVHMEQHWEGSYGSQTTGAAVSGVAVKEVRKFLFHRSPSLNSLCGRDILRLIGVCA